MLLTAVRGCGTLRHMSNPKIGLHAGAPHRRGGPHKRGGKPAPSKRQHETRHLRCPACGALRAVAQFDDGILRKLAASVRKAGGYKAISWEASAVTNADRGLLTAALRAAIERLGG